VEFLVEIEIALPVDLDEARRSQLLAAALGAGDATDG
jgi:hypothetical protein